mgnify:CR=1 FL=1
MAGTPIVLTLYDPKTDELKARYQRSFIPWKVLKEAVKISSLTSGKKNDETEYSEEMVDQISNLVISVFGDQFSREDLENGADITELIAVFNQIIAKANGIQANPPPAG